MSVSFGTKKSLSGRGDPKELLFVFLFRSLSATGTPSGLGAGGLNERRAPLKLSNASRHQLRLRITKKEITATSTRPKIVPRTAPMMTPLEWDVSRLVQSVA